MLVQAYLRRPSKGATGKEKLKKASRKREPLLNIGQGEGQWAEERWSVPCCRKPLPSSRPEAVPGHSRGLSFVQPYLPLLQVSFNLCPSQAASCRSSLPQTRGTDPAPRRRALGSPCVTTCGLRGGGRCTVCSPSQFPQSFSHI